MKINGILLDFEHQGTLDNRGQYGGEYVFKIRIRRQSKIGIGEEVDINVTIPEFKPRHMVKGLRKAIKELIEIREKALQNANEMKENFEKEATT